MIRRQSIRIFTYFAAIILAVALCVVLWPGGSPSIASAGAFAAAARAQDPLWQEIAAGSSDALGSVRQSELAPRRYRAFQLNEVALANLLAEAPMEFTDAAKDPRNEITLPMPDGAVARFRFVESPIMAPELAARFPEIKTYRGWGIDDPAATMGFIRTSGGFHAIVLSPRGAFCIDPLSGDDTRAYASYFTGDDGGSGAACLVGPGDSATARPDGGATRKPASQSANNSTGATLRTFRLAVAATGKYTMGHGGTVASAMAAIARIINDVNVIYEGVTIATFTAGPLAGASSIVVSDTTNNRIQGSRLPVAAGSWVLLGGGPGAGMGQFTRPSKIR